MAQPKKPEHLKQSKNVPVRPNPEQHKRLMYQAEVTGTPVAQRAMSCLMTQLERWEQENNITLPTTDSPTT